jgi:hypothetical protein
MVRLRKNLEKVLKVARTLEEKDKILSGHVA